MRLCIKFMNCCIWLWFLRMLQPAHIIITDVCASSNSFQDVDIALFSAGGSISKKYGPLASAAGCTVSSAQPTNLNLQDKTVVGVHLHRSLQKDSF